MHSIEVSGDGAKSTAQQGGLEGRGGEGGRTRTGGVLQAPSGQLRWRSVTASSKGQARG